MTDDGAASAVPPGPHVLVIDDDPGLAQALAWSLGRRGAVQAAESVADAKQFAGCAFDLLVLDLRLPDGDGLDSVAWFKATPFVVVTGFATTASTVRAMKLGAVSVLEKPVDIDTLLPLIAIAPHRPGALASVDVGDRASKRPAVDCTAEFIVRACTSESDLRTLDDWARHVGVSRTALIEQLRLAGVRAQHAKDFARALRAVVRGVEERCPPETLIESRDHRTLETFSQRTGLSLLSDVRRSVHDFLAVQRLISPRGDVIEAVVRRLLKQA